MEWYTLVMKGGRTIGASDLTALMGVDYLRDVDWKETHIKKEDEKALKASIRGKK
jgi:hypothetical protein